MVMSEHFVDKKDAIKALLKQGNLVVSGRGTGKTQAMIELLHEDEKSVIIVLNETSRKNFLESYHRRYGDLPDKDRVLVGTRELAGRYPELLDYYRYNVYVDEYYVNDYTGSFYAAATSFPVPVVVL
jgi:hypothetical protein